MNHSTSNSNGNRSTSNSLPLRTAITGFLNYKTAEGLSQRSVDSYKRILEQWADYAGNKKVNQFTDHDLNAYLVYMRTEYGPRRFGGDTRVLSPKSLRNIWITMCAFFTWAKGEFRIESPMKSVKRGQRIRFIYIAPAPGVWAWDSPTLPNPKTVDRLKYKELLIRAVQEILQPLGVTEAILKNWLISEAGYHAPPGLLKTTDPTRLALPLLADVEHLRVDSL